MSEDREITSELAIQILDIAIEKCRKTLHILEVGTKDFDNVYMEMQSYQMQKNTLLKDDVDDALNAVHLENEVVWCEI